LLVGICECTIYVHQKSQQLRNLKKVECLPPSINKLTVDERCFPLCFLSKATEEECFNLLNLAYIGDRYEEDYKITLEQLNYLILQIEELKKITQKICEEKTSSFSE
jgi:hypothetical protein